MADNDHAHGGIGYDSSEPGHVDCPECGRNMEPLGELHTADCPSALAQDALDYGHTGHYSLFGTYWCDTCNSPYCDLA